MDRREDGGRDTEEIAELVGPPAHHDVEQQGSRRIGGIGGEHPAIGPAGEVPQDPGIDGGQGQTVVIDHAALVQQPVHLGGREVGVEDQPGPFPHQREVAGFDQGVAVGGGPAVLPDDGAGEGATGAPVPGDHRLPLVGYTDGDRGSAGIAQPSRHFGQRGLHCRPDLVRIVLHPAGTGEVLGELGVGAVDYRAPGIHRQGPNPGGAGVDGDDDGVR